MKQILCLALCAFLLAGCQSPKRSPSNVNEIGSGYLTEGPTVAMDTERVAGSRTTLERNAELEAEAERLRADLQQRITAEQAARTTITGLERRLTQQLQEVARLQDQLERSQAGNADLQDQLLRARIAKARVEQELLQLQLANLIREDR